MVLLSANCKTTAANSLVEDNDTTIHFSLLTCSPGAELYSSYGHTAIRMTIPGEGVDAVFNYGTFDFNTPFFYLRFLNGTLDYMLSTSSFDRFMRSYERERRGVVEQTLRLSHGQRVELARRLIENRKPENRYYRYDFFFDNCATRIRDVLFAVGGVDPAPYQGAASRRTFRDCIHRLVPPSRWDGQGIDLILGSRLDHPVSLWQQAMLPDDMRDLLDQAGLLGEPVTLLHDRHLTLVPPPSTIDRLTSPTAIAALLIISFALVGVCEWRTRRWLRWADVALAAVVSILALLFAYLWVVSEIRVTDLNYNVLWASPLAWAQLVLLLRSRRGRALRCVSALTALACAAYWICAACGCQYMPAMALAGSACVAARAATTFLRAGRDEKQDHA